MSKHVVALVTKAAMTTEQPETPPYLYKYASASRALQIICDSTLYLAPAAGQNDLYEFRSRSLFKFDPDTKHRIYAKGLVSTGVFSELKEAFDACKELDFEEARETEKKAIEVLNTNLDLIMKHSGVTCFSAERNNQRMWGTYGDKHAGVVIEFSTDPARSRLGGHFGQVQYISTNPGFCPSHFMGSDTRYDPHLLSRLLYFKHSDWKGEKEWRLIMIADEEQSQEDRVVKFERAAMTRIFLGPHIAADLEAQIIAAADLNPPIPIFKRQIDELEASEGLVGFELLKGPEDFKYWFPQFRDVAGDSK